MIRVKNNSFPPLDAKRCFLSRFGDSVSNWSGATQESPFLFLDSLNFVNCSANKKHALQWAANDSDGMEQVRTPSINSIEKKAELAVRVNYNWVTRTCWETKEPDCSGCSEDGRRVPDLQMVCSESGNQAQESSKNFHSFVGRAHLHFHTKQYLKNSIYKMLTLYSTSQLNQ